MCDIYHILTFIYSTYNQKISVINFFFEQRYVSYVPFSIILLFFELQINGTVCSDINKNILLHHTFIYVSDSFNHR